MALSPDPDRLPLEVVTSRSFSFAKRGYDSREVRAFLEEVAEELRVSRAQVDELSASLAEAQDRLSRAGRIDEDQVTALLGQETARVLEAARSAADGIRARAVEDATGIRRRAEATAELVRVEADRDVASTRATADAQVADRLRAAAEALTEARVEAERLVAEAGAEAAAAVEAARAEGRAMVDEARAVRERMLRDLTRRRRTLRQQLEGLEAGRDRMAAALGVVGAEAAEAVHLLRTAGTDAAEVAAEAAIRSGATLTGPPIDEVVVAAVDELRAEQAAAGRPHLTDALLEAVAQATAEPEAAAEPEDGPGNGPAAESEDGSATEGDGAAVPEATPAETTPAAGGARTRSRRRSGAAAGDEHRPSPPSGRRSSIRVLVDEAGPDDEGVRIIPAAEATPAGDEDARPDPAVTADTDVAAPDDTDVAAPHDGAAAPTAADGEGADPTAPGPDGGPAAAPDVDDGPRGRSGLFDRLRREAQLGEPPVDPVPAASPGSEASDAGPDADATDEPGPEAEVTAEPEPGPPEDVVLGRRDRVVADLERTLTRRLKRTLADGENELLDALRRAPAATVPVTLLPDEAAHRQRIADAALPTLAAAAAAGAATSHEEWPDHSVETPQTRVGDLADRAAALTIDPLRAALADLVAPDDAEVGADAVRRAFRQAHQPTVDEVAARVVRAAHQRGLLASLAPGTPLAWRVPDGEDAPDEGVDGAGPDVTERAVEAVADGSRSLLAPPDEVAAAALA